MSWHTSPVTFLWYMQLQGFCSAIHINRILQDTQVLWLFCDMQRQGFCWATHIDVTLHDTQVLQLSNDTCSFLGSVDIPVYTRHCMTQKSCDFSAICSYRGSVELPICMGHCMTHKSCNFPYMQLLGFCWPTCIHMTLHDTQVLWLLCDMQLQGFCGATNVYMTQHTKSFLVIFFYHYKLCHFCCDM